METCATAGCRDDITCMAHDILNYSGFLKYINISKLFYSHLFSVVSALASAPGHNIMAVTTELHIAVILDPIYKCNRKFNYLNIT